MRRWPVIRHVRWVLWWWKIDRCAYLWRILGYADAEELSKRVLHGIWTGKC